MFEGAFQPMHLLLILIIAIFVFGPKRLPELGRSLGASIRGFKDAVSEMSNEKLPPSASRQDQPTAGRQDPPAPPQA